MTGGLHLAAQGLTVSGLLDSSISAQAGAGSAPDFSCGIEEYANLRFQVKIRDKAAVYGAVNLIAAAGNYANTAITMVLNTSAPAGINPSAYVYGENYIAGIEIERLYFRLNGEYTDFDGGLLRLPFGYGQVWGSSDFLNPKNPLKPDARLRAVLGAGLSLYPADELKILIFSASPRDPFSQTGKGWHTGISMDKHWDKLSLQTLYSYETPKPGSEKGIHRAGLSVKADLEAGLILDTLYTYNHEEGTKLNGLSLSAGADYSFFEGDLIVLAEYLYNGETSSTALFYGGGFSNNHYLYTGFTWVYDSFTSMNAALISCLSDISFTPVLTFNRDLFQGVTLTITAQIPMDRSLFSGEGESGEFGPKVSHFNMTGRIRLRF
jgi:hypothetical protein